MHFHRECLDLKSNSIIESVNKWKYNEGKKKVLRFQYRREGSEGRMTVGRLGATGGLLLQKQVRKSELKHVRYWYFRI